MSNDSSIDERYAESEDHLRQIAAERRQRLADLREVTFQIGSHARAASDARTLGDSMNAAICIGQVRSLQFRERLLNEQINELDQARTELLKKQHYILTVDGLAPSRGCAA